MSNIEWTGKTWNPLVGCSFASPGCRDCYAMDEAWRKMHHPHPDIAAKYAGTARLVGEGRKARPIFTGRVNYWEAALLIPFRRRKPTTWFVNSMSDLFHENVSDDAIDRIFAVMALSPQHVFQVLTKRPERMRDYVTNWHRRSRENVACDLSALPGRTDDILAEADLSNERLHIANIASGYRNIWLGVSVEDQKRADERISLLINTPARVRFLSCEPLLEPLRLPRVDFHCDLCGGTGILARWPKGVCHHCHGRGSIPAISTDPRFGTPATPARRIDQVIVGGKSGRHPQFEAGFAAAAASLRDQCLATNTAFFLKQMVGKTPIPPELLVRQFPGGKAPPGLSA